MHRLSTFLFFTLVAFSSTHAEDRRLINALGSYQKAVVDVGTLEVISCAPTTNSCPKVIEQSLSDIYRKGTAGTINAIISDGSLKNPRTACASSADMASRQSLEKLNQQLMEKFPDHPHLFEYTDKCESSLEKNERNLAQIYMTYDFHFKTEAIKSAMNDLLDSHRQTRFLLPADRINCSDIRLPGVQDRCDDLNQCQSHASAGYYLDMKTEEVSFALQGLKTLEEERRKLLSGTGRISSDNRKRAAVLEEDMNMIKDLNPLLKGERFKNILNGNPTPEQIRGAITAQVRVSQNEIQKKMADFNNAYKCLIGAAEDCDNFEDILKLSKYRTQGRIYPGANELNYASTFHECTENIKAARNDADEVLNDVGIDLALTLTPYAIVSGVKAAATLARTANMTSRLARTETAAARVGLAANAGYAGYYNVEEYNRCQREVQEFSKLGSGETKMSCSNSDRILVNNSNNSRCVTQALISAALMTPMAAESLRLARHIPRTVIPKSDIDALANKIRNGQSLSASEEALLLARLKQDNPLDKLLVRGVSASDKAFATSTLDKLYMQQEVSAEDLLKLSKLIKERNPPLLIITNQNDVDKIMDSKTIWGSTEGSVYAATRPIETKIDRIKTGVHAEKEGTFIFTPEAAALFKPHEITGLYSAFKNTAGQYKGPFGDIVIEESRKTIVNGRPHIIVTKARRAGAEGERLHSGQTTGEAARRLAGRRLVLDPLATGTGALVSIQAASTFTGVTVSDILFELLEEKDR